MRLYIVDAFTSEAFAGNSAGVVLLDSPGDAGWMQSVAAELKHAETAFVEVGGDGPKSLRWFTPEAEVDLCGHATLATTHVLGGEQTFTTRSGELRCRAEDGWVSMDFPSDPPRESDDDLSAILPGVAFSYVARSHQNLFAVAEKASVVRSLEPDLVALRARWTGRLIVTAPGDAGGVDFVSRFFAPGVGVDEDPVTGSAHCALAPYWAARLGKDELVGEQASARGGIVRMSLEGDRVLLSGQAVTVASGELHV
ncbi:PhzF family phenazine biosynthesis protein [Amycolatopsis umgeniensis]|uniref:Putative PhzF superfamily epimerase YddE/YHI9 n=1 Tax=Amycolatopsis umgeniensis TaxID=336628 RepID=A0A841B2S5_9PSEU|nr:PhzF family phenazine biosynthesis protein [Amycolatopsis umgeniensis]MBB5853231.1 putative PhzF superfamily epimerase YddE/YHI9 [Amycolatopsis umgeniensis]